ncbi:MAG: high potential iron-sulfur family protein [Collimonas fungivorans]|jgi:hypothetical protein|uniref:high-potential iron-sulfur protein n=1 Tax=Collimonas fungivorans TaxID=158899 RepID=UPI0026EE6406|nr:high-potential iron-sulfur protein [Collimonas fungivorans]MDB5768408.1 high potential iron-sulfur family protein [Collimonas fungivorans]
MKINRRIFMIRSLIGTFTLAAGNTAHSETPMLLESDSQARSLGYTEDSSKVDIAKAPKYSAGQKCAECQWFRPMPEASTGTCVIFSGKRVNGNGWCKSFVHKE